MNRSNFASGPKWSSNPRDNASMVGDWDADLTRDVVFAVLELELQRSTIRGFDQTIAEVVVDGENVPTIE